MSSYCSQKPNFCPLSSLKEEGTKMKWIVGLGNPGTEYRLTRHNIGFLAIDSLAKRFSIPIRENKCKALIGEGYIGREKVVLIKPMTYMNLSGEAVCAYMNKYKSDIADLIVLYDDIDTGNGNVRLRYQGGAGGHNGIKSIIEQLGTQSFKRIRMGISRPQPGHSIADYVLSTFPSHTDDMKFTVERICDVIEFIVTYSFEQAMSKFNG